MAKTFTPRLIGTSPPKASGGHTSFYDDVLYREPRLMVPGMAPVGPVKVDRTHPFGKHFRIGFSAGTLIDQESKRASMNKTVIGGEECAIFTASNKNKTSTILSVDDCPLIVVGLAKDGIGDPNGRIVAQQKETDEYNSDFTCKPGSFGGIVFRYNGTDTVGGDWSYIWHGIWVCGWTNGTSFVHRVETRQTWTASVSKSAGYVGTTLGLMQDTQWGSYWYTKYLTFTFVFAMPQYTIENAILLARDPYQFLIPA